ncbi:helix-turn-helix domain-containing protein [Streptomyces coeruleorubidus]|uniref:helix-turn-helix domain-containing protein n=1 Tax=Streptomyces coeruleorubidus TaxID=116188 RepID=UPI0033A52464
MSVADRELRVQVKAALLANDISQAEAARRLELSTKHMSQMLTGRAPLTLTWAERILALCGMRLVIGLQHDTQPRR